jgi:hypothetical protein
MFESLLGRFLPLSGVTLPPSLEAIKINPSSTDFISARIQAHLTGKVTGWTGIEAKVGICLSGGQGLIFVGSNFQASHRSLLETAITELAFPNPLKQDPLDRGKVNVDRHALVQGGVLSVSDFMSDQLPKVHGESLSFGGFKGKIFGEPIGNAIARRVLQEMVRIRIELTRVSGLDSEKF